MNALRKEIHGYIDDMPDEILTDIRPLLKRLSYNIHHIEKVTFEDLDEDEKEAVLAGQADYRNGDTIALEDI